MTMPAGTPLETMDQSQKFLWDYLMKEMRQHARAARYKSWAAQLLLWIAIISSALATLNIGTAWFESKNVNILAAVPAIIIYIMNTFKYESRARWHKVKARELQGFLFELHFQKEVRTDDLSMRVMEKLKELDKIKDALGLPADKLVPNNPPPPATP